MGALTEPMEAAEAAGLRYVLDEEPGIVRRRRGRGFSYHRRDGRRVSAAERERIEALVIPPAWTEVWICADERGHLQATGRDAAGRKQYLYHPTWREVRDADKFAALMAFGEAIGPLRTAVERDLARRRWDRWRTGALAVRLLDQTLVRVGGVAYAEDNDSYGLTTLLPSHVTTPRGAVELCFPGKSGVEQTVRIADGEVVQLVRRCMALDGSAVLCYRRRSEVVPLRAEDVNEYLAERTGEAITARDFRTWGASTLVNGLLAPLEPPDDEARRNAAVADAEAAAAEALGNTVAVARSAYIHPELAPAFAAGDLRRAWSRSRAGQRLSRAERSFVHWLRSTA